MENGPGSARRLLGVFAHPDEDPDGKVSDLRRMQAGDFFGERGLVSGQRLAHVVARESLTCLVLSRTPVTPYAGRGAGCAAAVAAAHAAWDLNHCLI